MRCDQARERIGAYLDGELSDGNQAALRVHLDGCRACAALVTEQRRVGRLVGAAGRVPAPPMLAARVRAALAVAAADGGMGEGAPPFTRWHGLARRYGALAAALLVACTLSVGATWWTVSGIERSSRLEQEVVAAHIRSLLQDSPIQVASSETHTVKPWFAGRADFAPDVRDLSAQGFPLAGGRLDYVQDRRVGAVVYRRGLHIINLFMWPATANEDTAPRLVTRNGYNLLGWNRNGIAFWAVSDLNALELRQFQSLL